MGREEYFKKLHLLTKATLKFTEIVLELRLMGLFKVALKLVDLLVRALKMTEGSLREELRKVEASQPRTFFPKSAKGHGKLKTRNTAARMRTLGRYNGIVVPKEIQGTPGQDMDGTTRLTGGYPWSTKH